jgi:hypothetical protein
LIASAAKAATTTSARSTPPGKLATGASIDDEVDTAASALGARADARLSASITLESGR